MSNTNLPQLVKNSIKTLTELNKHLDNTRKSYIATIEYHIKNIVIPQIINKDPTLKNVKYEIDLDLDTKGTCAWPLTIVFNPGLFGPAPPTFYIDFNKKDKIDIYANIHAKNCDNKAPFLTIKNKDLTVESGSDDLICCGVKMKPAGLGDCNGWKCPKCGSERVDPISFKLSGQNRED